MKLPQIIAILLLYGLGLAGSITWAIALGATPLLGLLFWTSFFAFSNAVGWALWWGSETWI